MMLARKPDLTHKFFAYHNGSAQDLNMFLIIDGYNSVVSSDFNLSASIADSGGESLDACLENN